MAYANAELAVRTAQTAHDRKLELFRGVVRSLVRDAVRVLKEMRCSDDLSASAQERMQLLNHYLSYLARLCDGRV